MLCCIVMSDDRFNSLLDMVYVYNMNYNKLMVYSGVGHGLCLMFFTRLYG